jgi:hypothetical protein
MAWRVSGLLTLASVSAYTACTFGTDRAGFCLISILVFLAYHAVTQS